MKTESVAVDIRTASGVGIQLVFATCVSNCTFSSATRIKLLNVS